MVLWFYDSIAVPLQQVERDRSQEQGWESWEKGPSTRTLTAIQRGTALDVG